MKGCCMQSIEAESINKNGEILIRLSTLISDRSLIERRREIRKQLLEVAISELETYKEYDLQEISIQLKTVTKCTLSDEQILQILNELEKENIVKHLHDIKYRILSKPKILIFEERTLPVWKEFTTFLKEEFPNYDPYLHNNVKEVFNYVIKNIIIRLSVSNPTLNQGNYPLNDIEEDIKDEIKNFHLPDKLNEKLPEILVKYLNSKPQTLNNFIFDCYYGLINIDLVAREQEIPDIDFGAEIEFLILDTNFIVPLLCQYDSLHPLCIALINQCNKLKIPLYYTSKTREEIWRVVKSSNSLTQGLTQQKTFPADNQFISNFLQMNTTWSIYYTYLGNWEEIVSKHSITLIRREIEQFIDNKTYEIVKQSLIFADSLRYEERTRKDMPYIPHRRSDENYSHDAFCVGLIDYLRKNKLSMNKKLGPWLLTYDSLLPYINLNPSMKFDDFGLVMQPRILLNYLLAYSKIKFNEEDRGEVAFALITLTTKGINQEITIEEYSKLVAAKLDLGLDSSEIIRQIFICSPLLEELKTALSNESDEGSDAIAYRIFTSPEMENIVDKIISQEELKKKYNNDVSDLESRVKSMSECLIKTRAEKEALESIYKQNNITVNVNLSNNIKNEIIIDSNVPPNISTLIKFLDEEGAFKGNVIEKPPSRLSLEKAKEWISSTKDAIENASEITESIKAILPYIGVVLQTLSLMK